MVLGIAARSPVEQDYRLWRNTRARQSFGAMRAVWTGETCALTGNLVHQFENRVAEYLGVDPTATVAAATGTGALQLALSQLDLRRGSEVVIPAFGWISVAGAVRQIGATPVLADVEVGSLHVSARTLEAATTGRTRAWVVTHMRGVPVSGICQLRDEAARRGISLIEDCAQAWGASVGSAHVGTFGDFAIFSTQFNKVISSGDGGIVVSAGSEIAQRIRVLAGYDPASEHGATSLQVNLRMSEVSGAILLPQVAVLDRVIERLRNARELMVRTVSSALARSDFSMPDAAFGVNSNGVTTQIWCETPSHAALLSAALALSGVAAYCPGDSGDPHNGLTWKTDAPAPMPGLTALSRYIDLPTPLSSSGRTRSWARAIGQALEACTARQRILSQSLSADARCDP